jgi:fatty acid desaturase
VREARSRHPARLRRIVVETAAVLLGHALFLALALALHGVTRGLTLYALCVALPALLATQFMMLTNYLQHVGCDPASPDDHSRNFTSAFWNWFVFENGLHTVHHEHPGVHWSRYRSLHLARAARIDPALNERSLFGFVLRHYGLAPLRRRFSRMPAPSRG